jgi:spermidine/putrescine-binding protein
VRIEYAVPQEGSQIWEDDWAIAAASLHPEPAHDFLNFLLRPVVASQEALYTRCATGNESALALLDESLRFGSSTYPPAMILEKLEGGLPLDGDGSRRREVLWRDVRG